MRRWQTITITSFGFLICVLLAIGGGVMFYIGIHKADQSNHDKACKNEADNSTTVTIGNVFHFSIDPGVPWQDSYNNPDDPGRAAVIASFKRDILSLFDSNSFIVQEFPKILQFSTLAVNARLLAVIPDYLALNLQRKTQFYGSFVFSGNLSASDVEAALRSKYGPTIVSESSHAYCRALVDQPTPAPPALGDYPCDPRSPSKTVIVMVDVAKPMDPTVTNAEKLGAVRSYLMSLSPPTGTIWDGLEMAIGVYEGSNAYLLSNWPCSSQQEWDTAISQLMLNETSESHNVTRALEFIRDEFSNPLMQLKTGMARSLILLADGFEYDNGFGENRSRVLAEVVAETFYTAAVLVSNARATRAVFSTILPSGYKLINIDYWYELRMGDIRSRSLWWICLSPPLSTPAPTISTPHWGPITRQTTPHYRPTISPTATAAPILPQACDGLQSLFLVDMSQSIDDEFENIITFIQSFMAETQQIEGARFGYISFNEDVQDDSGTFLGPRDFLSFLNGTRYTNGNSYYAIGFDALDSFAPHFNRSRPGLVVFITSENAIDINPGNLAKFGKIVEGISAAGIQFITTLAYPTVDKISVLNEIMQYGNTANNEGAKIIQTDDYGSILMMAPAIVRALGCRRSITGSCYLDLVWLVEDSEVVGNVKGQEYARGAILAYIERVKQYMGSSGDRMGLVYYSNPADGLHGATNRTAIALDLADPRSYDPAAAAELVAHTIPENPPGIYSDIALGLQLAQKALAASDTLNAQAIVIFGRGTYYQSGQDCCEDPFTISSKLLGNGVLMKGAVIGTGKNDTIMALITGQPNFQLLPFTRNNAERLGALLVEQLLDFRQQAAEQGNCIVPPLKNFCQEPADVVLIIHIPSSDKEDLFYAMKSFIIQKLLQAFKGMDYGGAEKLTRMAILTYYGETVTVIQGLKASHNLTTARSAIGNLEFFDNDVMRSNLSLAYGEAWRQFNNSGKSYASWSTIVITEMLDKMDEEAARNVSDPMLASGIYNFGLGTDKNLSNFGDTNGIWQRYLLLGEGELGDPDGAPAVRAANQLRDFVCEHSAGEGKSTPGTTQDGLTTQPGFLPQGLLADQNWPDLAIVIDASADSVFKRSLNRAGAAPEDKALNDKGFEVIRMFLLNTLRYFKFDAASAMTHVALLTFDGHATTLFNFTAHQNWASIYEALTVNWQYGPSNNHVPTKDIDQAIQILCDQVYQPSAGYIVGKSNYLWIFTTGDQNLHTNNGEYKNTLLTLAQGGVNIYAVGLGPVNSTFLATMSTGYRVVPEFADPTFGMATQLDLLGPLLFQISTNRRQQPPPISSMKADVVLVIDAEMTPIQLGNVQEFLRRFTQFFTVGQDYSRFALVVFDSTGVLPLSHTMNEQFDKAVLVDNINKIQPIYRALKTARFDEAIEFINSNITDTAGGKRKTAPSFAIVFTANNDNSYAIPSTVNLTYFNQDTYTVLVLGMDNQTLPCFTLALATEDLYAYHTPVVSFFSDLQLANLNAIRDSNITTEDMDADFTLVLDFANVDEAAFDLVLNYLISFTEKFSIGIFDAQVSALAFGEDIHYEFPFKDCPTRDCLKDKLGNWTLQKDSNSSLLTTVLNYIAQEQLTISDGWRQSKSYIMIFSAQDRSTWDFETMKQIRATLQQKNVFTYYVDISDGTLPEEYRQLFDAYEAATPVLLTNDSSVDQQIEGKVTTDYKEYRYPPPVQLSEVIADLAFVVDVSVTGVLDSVKILLKFLVSGLSIDKGLARVSVLLYNGDGVQDQIHFNAHHSAEALLIGIDALQQPPPTNATDFGEALTVLDEKILQMMNGYRANQSFVTLFGKNPSSLDNYEEAIANLQNRPYLSFYGFSMTDQSQDAGDDVYDNLRAVIPTIMAATQIVRTKSLDPDSGVIAGGNGYVNYILNVWSAYQAHPRILTTLSPTTSTKGTTKLLTTTTPPHTSTKTTPRATSTRPPTASTEPSAVSPTTTLPSSTSTESTTTVTTTTLLPTSSTEPTTTVPTTTTLPPTTSTEITTTLTTAIPTTSAHATTTLPSTTMSSSSTSTEATTTQPSPTMAPTTSTEPTTTVSTATTTSVQSTYPTPNRIKVDILFIFDQTFASGYDALELIKSVMSKFGHQFLISKDMASQWACAWTDGSEWKVTRNGFQFNDIADADALLTRIRAWDVMEEQTTELSLAAAIYQASQMLTIENGWRAGDPTLLVLLTGNVIIPDSCNDVRAAVSTLPADILKISISTLGDAQSLTLQCFSTTTWNLDLRAPDVTMDLLAESASSEYERHLKIDLTAPIAVLDVKLDVIFVIDQCEMTAQIFENIKAFISYFVEDYALLENRAGTQFAVANYGSDLKNDSFAFLKSQNSNDLQKAIAGLTYIPGEQGKLLFTSSIRAIAGLTLDETLGHPIYKPVAVVVFGAIQWISYLADPENIARVPDGDFNSIANLKTRIRAFLSRAYLAQISKLPLPTSAVNTDVFFIVDYSQALTDLQIVNEFMLNMINNYNFETTKFGVVYADTIVRRIILLNQYRTKNLLEKALLTTLDPGRADNFDIDLAFKYVADNITLGTAGFRNGALVMVTIVSSDYEIRAGCPNTMGVLPEQTVFFVAATKSGSDWYKCAASGIGNSTYLPGSGSASRPNPAAHLAANGPGLAQAMLQHTLAKAAKITCSNQRPAPKNPLTNAKHKDIYIIADTSVFAYDLAKILHNYFLPNFWSGYSSTTGGVFTENGGQMFNTEDAFKSNATFPVGTRMDFDMKKAFGYAFNRIPSPAIFAARIQIVIVIMASPKFTQIPGEQVALMQARCSVFGLSLQQNPDHLAEFARLGADMSGTFQPMIMAGEVVENGYDTDLYPRMGGFSATVAYSQGFPTLELEADWVFVIQVYSNSMNDRIVMLREIIAAWGRRFGILPARARIGVLVYGNTASPSSFTQDEAVDLVELTQRLNGLQTDVFPGWNLRNVVNELKKYRQGRKTFFYFLLGGSMDDDCSQQDIVNPAQNELLRGWDMTGAGRASLECIVGTRLWAFAQDSANNAAIAERMQQQDVQATELPHPPMEISLAYQSIVIYYDQSSFLTAEAFAAMKDFMLVLMDAVPKIYIDYRILICPLTNTANPCRVVVNPSDITGLQLLQGRYYVLFSCGSSFLCTPLQKTSDSPTTTFVFLSASPVTEGYTPDVVWALKGAGSVFAIDFLNLGASERYLQSIVSQPNYLWRATPEVMDDAAKWAIQAITTDYVNRDYTMKLVGTPQDVLFILEASADVTEAIFHSQISIAMEFIEKYSESSLKFAVYFPNIANNWTADFNVRDKTAWFAGLEYSPQLAAPFDSRAIMLYAVKNLIVPSAGYRGASFSLVILAAGSGETPDLCNKLYYENTGIFNYLPSGTLWGDCATSREAMAQVPVDNDIEKLDSTFQTILARANYEYFRKLRARSDISMTNTAVDVIFVIDVNNGVDENTYLRPCMQYVVGLTYNMTIGAQYTRFGAVLAASQPILAWDPAVSKNQDDLANTAIQ
ncbi:unnamed protein product, partial [Mesorhabditis spiculigera]